MSNYPDTELYTVGAGWKPKKKGSKMLASIVFDREKLTAEALDAAESVGNGSVRAVFVRNPNKKKDKHPDYNVCLSVPEGWEPSGDGEDSYPFGDDAGDGPDFDDDDAPF